MTGRPMRCKLKHDCHNTESGPGRYSLLHLVDRFAQHWDASLIAMYRAVQLCAPKPVLSTYPAALTAPPDAAAAHKQRSSHAAVAGLMSSAGEAETATAAHGSNGSNSAGSREAGSRRAGSRDTSGSGSQEMESTADRHNGGAAATVSKSHSLIRICTGNFSGGPDKNVFRFAGLAFSPRGRAVRVPFAAGALAC